MNIILATDSYKVSHAHQYPPGTTQVYSYFSSRGGEYDHAVFFGLQAMIQQLSTPITIKDIDEAEDCYHGHLGPGAFNRDRWLYILQQHKGQLPVRIRAVPEGTVVPTGNVLMTVENTDPACWWLTNYLETYLVQVWYPTTVATISRGMKGILRDSLIRTGPDTSGLPYMLHDFGCRGVSSMGTAAIGGAAHLVNFLGTDTVPGVKYLRDYYGAGWDAGVSIPASEHSTMTSWGQDREVDAYRNMLSQFPRGPVAVVSDSYDIYRAVSEIWGGALREDVLARDGTVVIRPDSGDPTAVLPRVLDILGGRFGSTSTPQGFKMLPPQVRVIQGDGVDRHSLPGILEAVESSGWSTANLVFGSGGGLLQKCNRDTLRFAFKCSHATIGDQGVDVYKDPVGDPWKASLRGRFSLVRRGEEYQTVPEGRSDDLLEVVFDNGNITRTQSLDNIRTTVQQTFE